MVQTMVAGGLGMLLYMILIFYSSITAQEVASEKGTKIMEVVFSSIKATDYFFARMLGLFGVIFTHIFVYVIGLVAFGSLEQISLLSRIFSLQTLQLPST
ncbi:MAG: ABC transporter permease [Streptococcus salivarius]